MTANPECSPGWRQRWPLQVGQFNPDVVVVLLSTDDTFDRRIDGREITFDSPEGDELTRIEPQEAIAILSGSGPGSCCSRRRTTRARLAAPGARRPVDVQPGLDGPVERQFARCRHARSVSIIDLNRFLGPEGEWAGTVDGVKVHTYDKITCRPRVPTS